MKWTLSNATDIEASPAVVNGTVYVPDTSTKTLYAVDASTGTVRWTFSTDYPIYTSPAVVDGVVYFGNDDGKFYALNASTGAELWNYTTSLGIEASPAVVGNTVYVGSNDNRVYALNASTGAELWNYTTDGAIDVAPAVADNTVYVGSHDNRVYALNASTGAELWNYTTDGAIEASPAVADNTVYVGSNDNRVYALNASTGAELWNYTTGDNVEASPAVADNTVYVGSYDDNLYALNASTGAERWNYTVGQPLYGSPVVVNDTVYFGDSDDGSPQVYALNASTGEKHWQDELDGRAVDGAPVVINNTVYVDSSSLYALTTRPNASMTVEADPGTVNETITFDASASSTPDGDIVSYEWDLDGDGVFEATGQTVEHTFDRPGGYPVALRVTTGRNVSDIERRLVQITKPSERALVDEWSQYHFDAANRGYAPNTTGIIGTPRVRVRGGFRNELSTSPAIVDGTVYVGTESGTVYAANASTGAVRWNTSLGGDIYASSPAVINETVYIGSYDKRLYALNASTGQVQWTYSTGGDVMTAPAVANGTVYFATNNGGVYALDATTGTKVWANTTLSGILMSPSVVDGTVYVGSSTTGRVMALNTSTGSAYWSTDVGEYVYYYRGTVVSNGTVYVGGGPSAESVYALNASTGREQWNTTTGANVRSTPAVTHGRLYVGNADGTLYRMNASTGAVTWTHSTGSDDLYTPAVVNGVVYIKDAAGKVYAVNATSGTELWNVSTGESGYSPAVVGDRLYTGRDGGGLYVLEGTVDTGPTAATNSDATVTVNSSVTFNASNSSDNIGIIRYRWAFDDGTTISGPHATRTYEDPGTYTATLSVVDQAGHTDTETRTITVEDRTPPVARAGPDRTARAGETLTFNASNSSDNVGVTSYRWTFGDGDTDTGVNVTHRYRAAGTYTVALNVSDSAGNTDTDTLTVEVSEAATSGGGGGGAQTAPPETRTKVVTTDRGATLVARNADGGERVVAEFDASLDSNVGAISQVSVTPTFSTSVLRVSITPPSPTPSSAPRLSDTEALGYFRADAIGLSNDRITRASIRFTVSSLPSGVSPEAVRLYRHHDGTWQPLETSVVREGVYVAKTPGFSTFAIGITSETIPAPGSTQTPMSDGLTTTMPPDSDELTTTGTGETTEQTSTSGSGFGVGTALLAIVTGFLLVRRRE